MSLLNDIIDIHSQKTYHIGLLQAKAYRMLNERTNQVLEPYNMTATEWAYLGTLNDHPKGIWASDLAMILGVKAPFVTALSAKFIKRNMVMYTKDATDARAKIVTLTDEGTVTVKEIERVLRSESKKWLKDASIKDIISYIKILKKLTE